MRFVKFAGVAKLGAEVREEAEVVLVFLPRARLGGCLGPVEELLGSLERPRPVHRVARGVETHEEKRREPNHRASGAQNVRLDLGVERVDALRRGPFP